MRMNQWANQGQMLNVLLLAVAVPGLLLVGCKPEKKVVVDGSSTVFPITEAVAEEFRKESSAVNVSVGTSGTGGGFKKFCNGETEISDASRPIKPKEVEACKAKNIGYIELPVAYDGLSVVVNKKNNFIKSLTVEELNHIFRYENPAKTWKDVNPAWPATTIKVFAPGQDSGTYDYFVETIIGGKGRVRADAMFSEDDNVLVIGVAGEETAIGFFGLAYYEENAEKINVVPVVSPRTKQPVTPTTESVKDGTYFPLSRPLFIYVRKDVAADPEVKRFIEFYLENTAKLSAEVGYVALGSDIGELAKKRFADGIEGSVYKTEADHDKPLMDLFK